MIVALIGLVGTIVAALLSSPLIEKMLSPTLTPAYLSTDLEFTAKHLLNSLGKKTEEVISYEKVPELDNSNGTSNLKVQIQLDRGYKNQIIEQLSTDQLSGLQVRDKIVELYKLSPTDPEGIEHTASCLISVNIPAGAKSVLTVEWTEQWAEGVINEGKDGEGSKLASYKVFIGYVEPCRLINQEIR